MRSEENETNKQVLMPVQERLKTITGTDGIKIIDYYLIDEMQFLFFLILFLDQYLYPFQNNNLMSNILHLFALLFLLLLESIRERSKLFFILISGVNGWNIELSIPAI